MSNGVGPWNWWKAIERSVGNVIVPTAFAFALLWMIHDNHRHNDITLNHLRTSVDNNTSVVERNNELLVKLEAKLD